MIPSRLTGSKAYVDVIPYALGVLLGASASLAPERVITAFGSALDSSGAPISAQALVNRDIQRRRSRTGLTPEQELSIRGNYRHHLVVNWTTTDAWRWGNFVAVPPEDEVILDETWVTITWDNAHRSVHTEWKAFATSAEFRSALMTALEAIKEKRAIAYLGDGRKVKVIVRKDQEWVKQVWIPLAVAAGLKRVAVVTAASGLGKGNVEDAVRLVDDRGLLMHSFDSVDAARKWIAEASSD